MRRSSGEQRSRRQGSQTRPLQQRRRGRQLSLRWWRGSQSWKHRSMTRQHQSLHVLPRFRESSDCSICVAGGEADAHQLRDKVRPRLRLRAWLEYSALLMAESRHKELLPDTQLNELQLQRSLALRLRSRLLCRVDPCEQMREMETSARSSKSSVGRCADLVRQQLSWVSLVI